MGTIKWFSVPFYMGSGARGARGAVAPQLFLHMYFIAHFSVFYIPAFLVCLLEPLHNKYCSATPFLLLDAQDCILSLACFHSYTLRIIFQMLVQQRKFPFIWRAFGIRS